MFQELLQLKQNNEVDQIILRGNAHMDQFIQLPQDAIDQGERNFPAHKIGAFISPHSHSEEAEEKLNALTYFQIIKLIQTSPNFIMHKGVICPRCQTSTYHKASSQCDICKGHYHTHCEELLAMHPDEHSRISSCSYCRNIQFHEFSMQLMLDCPHCQQWVAEKKRELVELVNDCKIVLRRSVMLNKREQSITSCIIDSILRVEDAILKARNSDVEEVDLTGEDNDTTLDSSTFPFQTGQYDHPANKIISVVDVWNTNNIPITTLIEHLRVAFPSTPPETVEVINAATVPNWQVLRHLAINYAITETAKDKSHDTAVADLMDTDEPSSTPLSPKHGDEEFIHHIPLCHCLFWGRDTGDDIAGSCPFGDPAHTWRTTFESAMVDERCSTAGENLTHPALLDHIRHAHGSSWVGRTVFHILQKYHRLASGADDAEAEAKALEDEPFVTWSLPSASLPKDAQPQSGATDSSTTSKPAPGDTTKDLGVPKALFHGNETPVANPNPRPSPSPDLSFTDQMYHLESVDSKGEPKVKGSSWGAAATIWDIEEEQGDDKEKETEDPETDHLTGLPPNTRRDKREKSPSRTGTGTQHQRRKSARLRSLKEFNEDIMARKDDGRSNLDDYDSDNTAASRLEGDP